MPWRQMGVIFFFVDSLDQIHMYFFLCTAFIRAPFNAHRLPILESRSRQNASKNIYRIAYNIVNHNFRNHKEATQGGRQRSWWEKICDAKFICNISRKNESRFRAWKMNASTKKEIAICMAAVGKTKFKNQFYLKHKLFNTFKLHTVVRNRRDCVCGKKNENRWEISC